MGIGSLLGSFSCRYASADGKAGRETTTNPRRKPNMQNNDSGTEQKRARNGGRAVNGLNGTQKKAGGARKGRRRQTARKAIASCSCRRQHQHQHQHQHQQQQQRRQASGKAGRVSLDVRSRGHWAGVCWFVPFFAAGISIVALPCAGFFALRYLCFAGSPLAVRLGPHGRLGACNTAPSQPSFPSDSVIPSDIQIASFSSAVLPHASLADKAS